MEHTADLTVHTTPKPPDDFTPTPAMLLFTNLTEAAEALSKFLLQFPDHVRPDFKLAISGDHPVRTAFPLLHVLAAIETLDYMGEHTQSCQSASNALHDLVYVAQQADAAIAPFFINVPPSGKDSHGASTLDANRNDALNQR